MLGIPLKEFREEAGISQRALGEGICDRGMVRACEEGRGEPEKLLVDALVQRTGKTINILSVWTMRNMSLRKNGHGYRFGSVVGNF